MGRQPCFLAGAAPGPRRIGCRGCRSAPAADPLTFPARPGNVVFSHAIHVRLVKGRCSACHPRLFPEDAKAPLHWKEGMHKPAEANHTSCGGCHRPGGMAFETRDHCRRCHSPEPNIY